MECNQKRNLGLCNCSCVPCTRKGTCCDCISYHLRARELSACRFPEPPERTWIRSFEYSAESVAEDAV